MTTRASLGRSYRSLWIATGYSAIGTGMTVTVLPLFAEEADYDPFILGLLGALGLAPAILFAMPVGMLADRFDQRKLMIGADIARAVVLVVATLVALAGEMSAVGLGVVAFLISAGEVFYLGSVQAFVPTMVPPERLDDANGRLQAVEDSGRDFVGPPIGSFLFGLASWLPLLGDALSYVLSAGVLSRLSAPPRSNHARSTAIGPAWRAISSSRTLLTIGVSLVILSMAGSSVYSLLVLIARDQLGVAKEWYGAFLVLLALGATIAGLTAGRLRQVLTGRSAMAFAVALNATSYMVVGATSSWVLGGMALFLWGFAITFGIIVSLGIRQRLVPVELLGRAMGLFRTAMGVGSVTGALVGGAIASATSPGHVAVGAGVLQLPVVALVLLGVGRDADTSEPAVDAGAHSVENDE